jgi:Ca2+-binding EF-hand superfamily protein
LHVHHFLDCEAAKMGICQSDEITFKLREQIDGQDSIAEEAFHRMKIQKKELDKFYHLFLKIDKRGEGFITPEEVRNYFHVGHSTFNKRLFIDYSGTGRINFFDFVSIVSLSIV